MSRRGAILQDYGGRFEPMPLDNQLAAANFYQRDKEQANQLNQNKKFKSDKEAADLIGDVKLDHIGDNTIDVMTDKQLQGLQSKLMDMHLKGATTTDLQLYAQRELPKISNGHTVAKNKFEQIKSGLTDLGKDYPSGDLSTARSLAAKDMLNDVVDFDEKGNAIGYKDPSIIPERNYVAPLLSDEKLAQWYKPSGALETHIKGLPTPTVGESTKVRDKKGREIDNAWTGQGSVFSEIKRDENGKAIGMEIKSEVVPLGKNADGTVNTVSVLPKEEFDMLIGNPQAKADFTFKFNEDLRKNGINPYTIDPRAKDILQRQYARDYLDKTGVDGRSFIPKMADKQPLPPRISVKVNNGTNTPVMDIVTPVKDYFKENEGNYIYYTDKNGKRQELEGTAQLNLFNNEVTTPIVNEVKNRYPKEDISADNIYYRKIGNDTWVVKADEASKINPEKDTPVFKLDDYSNVTGNKPQGVKSKNEALRQAQGNKQPEPTKDWSKYKRN